MGIRPFRDDEVIVSASANKVYQKQYIEALERKRRLGMHRRTLPIVTHKPADRLTIKRKSYNFDSHIKAYRLATKYEKANRLLASIICEVAALCGFTEKEIKDPTKRKGAITIARHHAMYRLATETNRSLVEIGRALGGMDHTSIMYGVQKHCHINGYELPRGMKKLGRFK